MRVTPTYLFAIAVVLVSTTVATAQEYAPPPVYGPDRIRAIEQRLAEQEAELRVLRERQSRMPVDRLPVPATQTGLSSAGMNSVLAAEAAAKEKAAKEGYVVGSDLKMSAKWDNGLELQTPNKDFRLHVGGRTQVDASWYSGDQSVQNGAGGVGPLRDAANFRRARLRVDGTMYEVIEFACEYDFVNTVNLDPFTTNVNVPPSSLPPQANPANIPVPTELWVGAAELPVVGHARVGNMKDPFGFEHLTSSRFLNFMERSFAQDLFEGPFNNGFAPGVLLFNSAFDERMTWWIGEFKNINNPYGWGVGDGEYETVGRVTFLPVHTDKGHLLHLGVAGKYMDLDEEQIRFRTRGDIRSGPPGPLNPVFANTGNIVGSSSEQIGLELAGVYGPWTLQAEYFGVWVSDAVSLGGSNQPAAGTALGTPYFNSGYVEMLYFLTGEHQSYNRGRAIFERVIPHENFFLVRSPCGNCSGWGAWQVGVRGQYADLRSSGVDGGQLQAVTLGLNWFLNPNLKVQWNGDWTHRDFLAGTSNGDIFSFGTRVAFDF